VGPTAGIGSRDVPVDLEPDATYVPDTYERAVVDPVSETYDTGGRPTPGRLKHEDPGRNGGGGRGT